MNKIVIAAVISILLVALGVAVFFGWYVSVVNTEISLRTQYNAQAKSRETSLDKMKKVLLNQYKVTGEFADAFVKTVQAQAEGRKGGDGSMVGVKLNTESSALGISPDLYRQMANSISGELNEYKISQDRLTDIWREHTSYCEKIPYKWFIGDKINSISEPIMITSASAKEAEKTGVLEDNLLK